MSDSSPWTTSLGGIKVPPLQPVPPNLAKPDDALCDICRTIDFEPSAFFIGMERDGPSLPSSDGNGSEETDGDDEEEEDGDDDSIAGSDLDGPDLLDEDADDDGDEEEDEDEDDDDASDMPSESFAHDFINLGKITDVRSRTHCPFCRLALAAVGGPRVPSTKNGIPVTVEVSIIKNGVSSRGNKLPPTRVLMPSVSAGDEFVDEAAVFPEIAVLANDSPAGPLSLVRPVCAEKIDFGVVGNWLAMCETFHGDECRKKPGLEGFPVHPATILKEFRLIDVEEACLARATSESRYTALSYVWGSAKVLRTLMSNVESLEQPGAFNTPEIHPQIPLTIRDAMQATKGMGIRHLWVDALCIVQDDEGGEKLPHIKQMNRIYETAEVVIVAMSGKDANAGLPGVRPWTRNYEQYIEQMTPKLRLGIRTSYGNDCVGSVYGTRGWTYQETSFARRQLIFVGGQTVFLCRYAGNWSEDRVVEDAELVLAEMLEGGGSSAWDGDDDIRSYEGPVQNYSSRTLTFRSDVYAAFAGVAQRVRDLLQTDLCHGIPPRYFDWCLLWDPMNAQARCEGTPSWSWTGWTGGVFPRIWDWYSPKIKAIQKALKVRTWIIWYQRVAHDSTECRLVWDYNAGNAGHKHTQRAKNFYGGKAQSRFAIDCSRTHPTERTLTGAPTYYPDILCDAPGSGFLQFWTVAVQFRLDKPVSSEGSATKTWFGGHTQLGIFGSSGRELGTISVADVWLAKSSLPLTREFILLCEARDERAEDYKYDDEPGWRYKVMLLEWHGEYAERVAVGSINKGDELEGSPVWKEIILG
ncbi:HET-domain-containing protein [Nemania sp. FL0031]|nr:HET-domain-containing protein [Nemania sp. FL0031]